MTAIHQFLPSFAGRDAVGMQCLRTRDLLRGAGYASEIVAGAVASEVRGEAYTLDRFTEEVLPRNDREDTVALYHFSIGSPFLDRVTDLGLPVGIYYHNITDAHHFLRWNPAVASELLAGRRQLSQLAGSAAFAIAASHFSEAELRSLGFAHTEVVPLLVDFADYAAPADSAVVRARTNTRHAGGEWLFVGRIAPNKCQHDVIAGFAAYRAVYDRDARLTFVGGRTSDTYARALEGTCEHLGVTDAVTFADLVSQSALLAYYKTSDVFVSASEHEGFGVPLLEAMHFDVPVVAYASSAVPETVGEGGLLLADKDPMTLATAVHEVMQDEPLRKELVAAGRERVESLSADRIGPVMLETLRRVAGPTAAG